MHTHRRLIIVLALLLALVPVVPLRMTGLLSFDERERTRESLQDAIGDAAVEYRQRGGLESRLEKGKTALTEAEQIVRDAERRKAAARQNVLKWQRIKAKIESRTGASFDTVDDVERMLIEAKKRFADLLRQRSGSRAANAHLVRWVSAAPWGSADERLLRYQERLVADLTSGLGVMRRLEEARANREDALLAYAKATRTQDDAAEKVRLSEEQLRTNRRIMTEVHEQVIALQGELARIDARLRQKAGRALVEKGLLDAEDVRHASAADRPMFSWPVYGRISAGFLNSAYFSHFGVKHYGDDIVVPQKTPVAAAADGIVFLVREGGATGYTYILIGHRDGYATLYGHIVETQVRAGQEVAAGDIIGLSGGTPGTNGAGPMTTAAHLHFEVIQNGVNIDPLSVLP